MPLKAVVDDVTSLPETQRSLYVERDGKHFLDVEGVDGYSLEDVSGLKTTFGKEMAKRKQFETELKRFKDIDPDKAREALATLESLGDLDQIKDVDKVVAERFKIRERQLREQYDPQLADRDGKINRLTKNIEGLLIDAAASQALAEAKGSVELLLPHVQRNTRVRETENGGHVVEVIDKDGNARIANSKGDLMTIKDLVQEMRKSEAFGRAFDGSGQSGGGTQPGSNGANGGNPSGPVKSKADIVKPLGDKATAAQKRKAVSDWIETNGLSTYNALPGTW
jgi:hypothetical protein